MSDRFTRLYTAPTDLYAENSPVIISAGALLKDNMTGKMIAQLKFKNILGKKILALKVLVHPLDILGEALGTSIEKTYLDLSVSQDVEFGQKDAIFLPDPSVRAFTAEVVSVIFEDKTSWNSEGANWEQLPAPSPIAVNLQDNQLIKQWKINFGKTAEYVPGHYKNLWRCTCGHWNVSGVDLRCRSCFAEHSKLFSCDYEGLRLAKEKRVQRETEILKQRKAEEIAYFKRAKRYTVALIIFLLLVAAGFAFYFLYPFKSQSGQEKGEPLSDDIIQTNSSTSDKVEETASLPVAASNDDIGVGDLLSFGSYEQDNNKDNGKEPIEWVVLYKKEDSVMLLSQYALDWKQFNDAPTMTSWDECSLRKWLNNDFFNEAFSTEEKKSVLETYVDNNITQNNEKWTNFTYHDTIDKVYLLSYQEVMSAFLYPVNRRCVVTKSVLAESDERYVDENRFCFWWLRSPGKSTMDAAFVNKEGTVYYNSVLSGWVAVRPVIWIDLNSAIITDHVKESDMIQRYYVSSSFKPGIVDETSAVLLSQPAGNVAAPNAEETASLPVAVSNDDIGIGDLLSFGMYEQDRNPDNGGEPIEWLVLARKDNSVMLLSKYALASKQFHEKHEISNWQNCDLRIWLNNYFYSVAFSTAEQNAVLNTVVDNSASQNNPIWNHYTCDNTVDKVYLLSYQEVMSYFNTDESRKCGTTASIRPESNASIMQDEQHCFWWLRSPGKSTNDEAFVNQLGTVYYGNISRDVCVRPVIWVDLNRAVFSGYVKAPDIADPYKLSVFNPNLRTTQKTVLPSASSKLSGTSTSTQANTALYHSCEAGNCTKEGTKVITGLSGKYEYYCEQHYNEMLDIVGSLIGSTDSYSSSAQTSGTRSTSTGEKNALRSAQSYLSAMGFSYSGLIEQLEFEGYSHAEAKYAADNCGASWKEQAARVAKSYLNTMSFSRSGLIEQLQFEGFTYEQAVYGVEKNGY